jgi:hypothetical protein
MTGNPAQVDEQIDQMSRTMTRKLAAKHKAPGKPKRRGITNAQAKYLAVLQRQLGTRYSGNGMTIGEASTEIGRCQKRLGYTPKPYTPKPKPKPKRQQRTTPDRVVFRQIGLKRPESEPYDSHAVGRRRAQRREQQIELAEAAPPRRSERLPLDWQLHDLKVLAKRAGEPTPNPETRSQAAEELARLKRGLPAATPQT